MVTLSSASPEASIHYTLDGREPDLSAPVYKEPLLLRQSAVVKAFASQPGIIASPVSIAEFIRTTKFKSLDLKSEISPNYPALGKLTLSDNVRATTDFHDGNWLGFEGNDFEVVIDLGTVKPVKKIRVGFLQNIGSWIFYPQQLEYAVSEDGKIFFIRF